MSFQIRITSLLALICLALAFGISAFAASLAFSEWSHDRGFTEPRDIYRVEVASPEIDGIPRVAITDPTLPRLLNERLGEIPGFAAAGLQNGRTLPVYESADRQIRRDSALTFDADSEILGVLGLGLMAGSQPFSGQDDSALISRSLAEALFNDPGRALGSLLPVGKDRTVTVIGVFDDLPQRSHLAFDMLMPRPDWRLPTIDDFTAADFQGSPTGRVADVIDTMTYVRMPEMLTDRLDTALEDIAAQQSRPTFDNMQRTPLRDIYFSNVPTPRGRMGDRALFWILIGAAILFYAMFAGQLRLMLLNGQATRMRQRYLLKSIGYGPRQLFLRDATGLLLIYLILLSGAALVVLYMSAEARTAVGWTNHMAPGQDRMPALIFAGAVGVALLLALLASTSLLEIRSVFRKPVALLGNRRRASAINMLPLQIVVLLNFAMATLLICLLWATQSQIQSYLTAERGFTMQDRYLIEGWNNEAAGRGKLQVEDIVAPLGGRLESALGPDNVARVSTDFRSGSIGRVLVSLEDGRQLRLQTIHATASLFDILDLSLTSGAGPFDPQRASASNVIVSRALADFLRDHTGREALGREITYGSGSRMQISAIADDIRLGDPELSDPRILYVLDDSKASNILIRQSDRRSDPVSTRLSGLQLSPAIYASPLADAVNLAARRKSQRRNFMVALAVFVTGSALLSAFNLFLTLLRRYRKEIIIRQVYGYTLWPILLHWTPRMIWPVMAGAVLGIAAFMASRSSTLPGSELTAHLSLSGKVGIAIAVAFTGFLVLASCVWTLSRRIDLPALRDKGLLS